MNIRLLLYVAFLIFFSISINGQVLSSSDSWMEYVEELTQNTENSEQIETLYNELSFLVEHPLDINQVTKEQLEKLPFLNDRQIDSIIAYREKYGKMATLYELKNIEDMDFQTISYLLPFVYINDKVVEKIPFTVQNLLKYGKNELKIRYDRGFQQKKGYYSQPDSILEQYSNRQYVGEPFYHSLHYSYVFDDRLQGGFIGEKDAGEAFWNHYHKGYDYYSFHLFLKDIGKIKSVVLGDYKVSFGQGLVISNDFTPSRSSLITQVQRRTNGFRRHFSTNEVDFFRGVATTLSFDRWDVSLFYSYRKMDAQLDGSTFTSIKTDGLHRLIRDCEKQRQLPMQTIGGNVRYVSTHFHIGLTTLFYSFGKYRMEPDAKPYNLFYFRGNQQMNVSLDYQIKRGKIKFYGETALSKNGALATLNAFELTPVSYFSFLLLHRYYDKRYQAIFGNAFSQNSMIQNEKGFYAGLQFVPFAYWKLSTYADIFRFPWLKYEVDAPSSGKEYMVQLDYTPDRKLSAYFRYKYKQKEVNGIIEKNRSPLVVSKQQRMRFQLKYDVSPTLFLRFSLDGIGYRKEKNTDSKGFMVAQSVGWKPDTKPVQMDVYVAFFRTDDYNSRISSYEKNLLYSFYMPSFYGKGFRFSSSFRWNMVDRLSLSVKIGHTYYNDRDEIGTDLEKIEGKRKTDIYTLLRWKF